MTNFNLFFFRDFLINLRINLKSKNFQQFMFYMASVSLTMISGFFLLYFLVRKLSPENYGQVVLFKSLFMILVSLAGMGFSQSAVYWYSKKKDELVIGTVLYVISVSSFLGALFFLGFIWFLSDRIILNLEPKLILTIFTLFFMFMNNNEILNWQRAQHSPVNHALISSSRSLVNLVFILFCINFHHNVSDYIYGLTLSECFVFVALFFLKPRRLFFDKKLMHQMFYYGLPHSFVITCSFLTSYADRYVISFITGNNSNVAYYDSIMILVTSFFALLNRPLNLYLFPAYTKTIKEKGESYTVNFIQSIQNKFLIFSFFCASFLILFKEFFLVLVFPPSYLHASVLVAPIILGTILNGLFIPIVSGLYIAKKTKLIGLISLIVMVVNLISNFILVPIFGLYGAALAVVISSIFQIFLGFKFSNKYLPIKFPTIILLFGSIWIFFLSLI
jgi:O-antigen/teichoic acid export membrane protein